MSWSDSIVVNMHVHMYIHIPSWPYLYTGCNFFPKVAATQVTTDTYQAAKLMAIPSQCLLLEHVI